MATPGANPHQHASNGTSHPSGGAEALTPDRDMLIRFVDVMFRNADRRGFVSFRVFKDNGKSERAILISALPARRSRVRAADADPGAAGGELVRARGVRPAGLHLQGPSQRQDRQHPRRRRALRRLRPGTGHWPRHTRSRTGPGHRRLRERRRMDERRRPAKSSRRCICTGG